MKDRVAGSVESIAEITADTLYKCHRAFYCPDNMALCVEGDVDPERIMQIVEEEITEPYRTAPTADYGKAEKLMPVGTVKRETMPVSAPQFLIGAKFKPEKSGRALQAGSRLGACDAYACRSVLSVLYASLPSGASQPRF